MLPAVLCLISPLILIRNIDLSFDPLDYMLANKIDISRNRSTGLWTRPRIKSRAVSCYVESRFM